MAKSAYRQVATIPLAANPRRPSGLCRYSVNQTESFNRATNA